MSGTNKIAIACFGVLVAAIPPMAHLAFGRPLGMADDLAIPGAYLCRVFQAGGTEVFLAASIVVNFLLYASLAYLLVRSVQINFES